MLRVNLMPNHLFKIYFFSYMKYTYFLLNRSIFFFYIYAVLKSRLNPICSYNNYFHRRS